MSLPIRLLALSVFAFASRLASAACECGYATHDIHTGETEVYTEILETDFLHLQDITKQKDWVRQVWDIPAVGNAAWGRNNTLDEVTTNPLRTDTGTEGVHGGNPGLQLWVRSGAPKGGYINSAEVASARRDFRYGSFRAGARYTGEPGTCGSFFTASLLSHLYHPRYYNDTQEIDVELLSSKTKEPDKAPIWLVIHAIEAQVNSPVVNFRPDNAYHEYRFDWTPEKITFYTDGQFLWETTTGVPSHASDLKINHWSNGDPGWSEGPPAQDAHMDFSYIKAYFNSSDDGRNNEYKLRCKDPKDPNAICKVPDQTTPPDPSITLTTFLTPNKGVPPVEDAPTEPAPVDIPPANAVPSISVLPAPVAETVPAQGTEKSVSTDGTCGGDTGNTCLGSTFGDCCSSYGFCGSTKLYCSDPKCQPDFGTCGGGT